RNQRIDLLENLGEVAPNQLTHSLRTQIIGVVVTGAQNVSAQNDPPFHFRSETLLTRAAVKIEHAFRIFSAIPVPNAVEASKVRGSFSGGNNVIDCDRVFGAAQ